MDKDDARERGGGGGGRGGRGQRRRGKRMKDEQFFPTKSQMLEGTESILVLNTSVLYNQNICTPTTTCNCEDILTAPIVTHTRDQ